MPTSLPCIVPCEVAIWAQLVYSNCSPGLSSGWWPTNPKPRTCCTTPFRSLIRQWRAITCAATSPVLRMVTV